MRYRGATVLMTIFVFLTGITLSSAEARCGGCKRKRSREARGMYQPQSGASCCSTGLQAQGFQSSSSCCSKGAQTIALSEETNDTKSRPMCKYCGMNRQQFAQSRMVVQYDDGAPQATCSLHCAAIELASAAYRMPKSIQVGDFVTMKLVDAEKAHWVIGGSKQGVMTKTATWAFEKREDAETFVRENGGKIGDFDEALAAAFEDMKGSIKMIRQKRK